MDYKKHYDRLIERAKFREIDCYVERHHIMLRCIGGSDSKENIVRLTAEEHYVAHQLLHKMHPRNPKLLLAVKMMTVSGGKVVRNNKMYGWLRKKFSEVMSCREISDVTRKKMSNSAKNRKASDETKSKMSLMRKGKPLKKGYKHTDESRALISAAGRTPCKEETKIKIGLANKNRKLPPRSDETRQKLSDSALGRIYKTVVCNYCGKEGGITGMKRWHFENCKEKHDRS
jgi:hypothetical protein